MSIYGAVLGGQWIGQYPIGFGDLPLNPDIVAVPAYQPPVNDAVILATITYTDGTVTSSAGFGAWTGAGPLGMAPIGSPQIILSQQQSQLHLSDRDWTSEPGDAVPNTRFEGRLATPQISWSIPVSPSASRRVVASVGSISLANDDALYDNLPSYYGVDGQSIAVTMLPSRGSATTTASDLFNGVGAQWSVGRGSLDIAASDVTWKLANTPLLRLLGGTGGADGYTDPGTGLSNQAGKGFPRAHGRLTNISPMLIDPINGIYGIHDGPISSVDGAYWMGAPVTRGTVYTSYAALASASTTAGTYDYCLGTITEKAWIKPGSPTASGQFTCDVHGALDSDGVYREDHASVLFNILSRYLPLTQIDLVAFKAYSNSIQGAMGIYFPSQTNVADAANKVMQSCLGVWGDFGNGLISCANLAVPIAVTGGLLIDDRHIKGELQPVSLPSDVAPCIWRVRVGYAYNWTPLSGNQVVQPSGSVTIDRRNYLQSRSLVTQQADASRLYKNSRAVDYPANGAEITNIDAGMVGSNTNVPFMQSMFANKTDADALASSLLNIWAPGVQIYTVPVGTAWTQIARYSSVFLIYPRYGFEMGKWVRVIGAQISGTNALLTVMTGTPTDYSTLITDDGFDLIADDGYRFLV